jgi:hypothetical protein
MRGKGDSFAQRMARWEVLVEHVKEDAVALPYLATEVAELERLLGAARQTGLKQEALRAGKQGLTAELVEIGRQADILRGRMRAILNGKLGFTEQALLRYGLTPRRVPRRQPKAETKPNSPGPVATAGMEAEP